jgi:undecaprenyl-diphosphatase
MNHLDISISILLGIIQGLTEFIPVSSTAHIRILPAFLDINDVGAAYTAVIQLGSLIALLFYFKKDLYEFSLQSFLAIHKEIKSNHSLKEIFRDFKNWNYEARMPFYLIIGTIPISIFGLLLKNFIKGTFRSLYVVAGSLILFAILLWISDVLSKKSKTIKDLNLTDTIWIGLAQSLALIPGASRSGVTLMAGLFLNFNRESSMRFSFLLSIPAIALSGFYELFKDWKEISQLGVLSVVVGTLTAIIVSYVVIAGLLRYLRTHNTLIFVIYRIMLGFIIYYLLYNGIINP